MSDAPLSRRDFLSTGAALTGAASLPVQGQKPVAATGPAQPARASAGPIRILTTTAFEPHEITKIQAAAPNVQLTIVTPAEFRKRLPEAEVVYGTLAAPDLAAAANVKWVQTPQAGVETIDPEFMTSPIVLTNMARTFAPAISETAMGLLLCLTRGITTYYMPQFAKRQMNPVGTAKSAHHVELAGKTMGIVGMGGIGSAVARRAHDGFDMRIVGTDARPIPRPEYVVELRDPS